MMTANDCRAKAVEALARVEQATSPEERASYVEHAREWAALAVTADIQAGLMDALMDRNDASEAESDAS